MLRTILAGILLFGLSGTLVNAAVINPQEWKSINTFTTPAQTVDTWYVSEIDSAIWALSEKDNLGDIRLVDSQNVEVPYVIVRQGMIADTDLLKGNTNTNIRIVENTVQKNENKVDKVIVFDTGKEGQVYTGIRFNKSTDSKNFRKKITVYISDSLLGASSPSWREVEQNDVIYNYTDPTGFSIEDVDINFSNIASRYIKVRFEDDFSLSPKGVIFQNQIQVTSAYVQYDKRDVTIETNIENYLAGNFNFSDLNTNTDSGVLKLNAESVAENNVKKSTEVTFKDVKAITSIMLSVDGKSSNFKRDITVQGSLDNVSWQTIATGQIYRIDSPIYKGESVSVAIPVTTSPYVRVIVQNNNDVPLKIDNSAKVTTQKIGLLFKVDGNSAKTLKLLIGNKNATTPVYEMQKTITYFNSVIPVQIVLENAITNPMFQEEKPKTPIGEKYPYIVNGILMLFVVVAGYLGHKWTKKA